MNLDEISSLDASYLVQNYGRAKICFSHGRGEFLYDINGKEYLDLVAGIAVNVLGHAHPAIVSTICKQAEKLIHVSNLYLIKEQAELGQLLASVLPQGLERSLFVNSGTEANEAALKLAFRHTGKPRIVSTYNSFHGRTAGSLSATGQMKYHSGFEPLISKAFDFVKYGSVEQLKEKVSSDTAGIILEAVQGEGGIVPADVEFMKTARDLCDDYGALLILDEVQTGFGRTGRMFGFEHYGVQPDIVTMAKAMGGGVPIGAMVTTDEVSKSFTPGSHGTTFGGNPLACSVAKAVLSTLIEERLPQRAYSLGNQWIDELRTLCKRGDLISDVRGLGLMLGIDMGEYAKSFQSFALDNGILVNVCGRNVVRLVPPLIISRESITRFNETLSRFILAYQA